MKILHETFGYSSKCCGLLLTASVTLAAFLISTNGPLSLSAQNSSVSSSALNQQSVPPLVSPEGLAPPLVPSERSGQETHEEPQQQQYSLYESPQHNFSIEYPLDWQAREGRAGVVATFSSRFESDFDPFAANFAIGVENLTAGNSLDNYTRSVVSLLQSEPPGPNFTLRDGPISIFGGFPAQSVVFTVTSPNERGLGLKPILEGVQIWTVHDNFAYILSFAAEQDKFSRYAPIMEHIIESFRITRTAG
jgi:hypothetical protein